MGSRGQNTLGLGFDDSDGWLNRRFVLFYNQRIIRPLAVK
jgi:hypothetical protein